MKHTIVLNQTSGSSGNKIRPELNTLDLKLNFKYCTNDQWFSRFRNASVNRVLPLLEPI